MISRFLFLLVFLIPGGSAQAFDPLGLSNPGKMLPGGAPALAHVGLHPLERAGVVSRE